MKIYLKRRNEMFTPADDASYPLAVLQWDGWNDHSYSTLFVALIYPGKGQDKVRIGEMKIQFHGQTKSDYTFPYLSTGEAKFEGSRRYCSLGVSLTYYEELKKIGQAIALDFLESVFDAAYSDEVRDEFQDDECFKISLLRDSDSRRALDEAGSLFGRERGLVSRFSASLKLPDASAPHEFKFDFSPHRGLPYRMHAMVGLNGVGKTQVMARLAMLFSRFSKNSKREDLSTLETEGTLSPVPSIYNVVAISFSAFDDFERPTVLQGNKFKYSYCGLRSQKGRLLTEEDLLDNIRRIVTEELDDAKKQKLAKSLERIIKVDDIESFVADPEGHRNIYDRLSAGQRIALNALCHTLAKVQPRTLVLFDEPELHLHPQLLATMMSAFNEILTAYDSFSIIATHSPIVIQQIPSRYVFVVKRDRRKPFVLQPSFETFGETLSEISRHVFSATESDRDYRNVLNDLLKESDDDVEKVNELFDGKLSLSAQIYLESRKHAAVGD